MTSEDRIIYVCLGFSELYSVQTSEAVVVTRSYELCA
jgi:hypothetical protein